MTEPHHPRIAIIACGVLEWNIEQVAQRIPDRTFVIDILPAQLHQNPGQLRELLQSRIDELDETEELDAIVLGYGVCGRGTIGLHARRAPLVVPRVQDCIGVFLGSHCRYMDEFSRRPGTRYLSHGWYEKTRRRKPKKNYLSARDHSLYGTSLEQLQEQYGRDNACFICEFRESWKRNYQRAAYIRFPGEPERPPGQSVTEGLAASLDWEHEILDGDDSLLFSMLSGAWTDPRLLVVPPRSKTVAAPGDEVIAFAAGTDSHVDEVLARYAQPHEQPPVQRQGLGLGVDTGGTYTDAVIFDFTADRVLAGAKSPTTHDDLAAGIISVLRKLPLDLLQSVSRVGLSTTLATNAFVERKGRPVGLLLMSPFELKLDELPFRFVGKLDGVMTIDGSERQPIDPEQVRQIALNAQAAGCEALAISGFGSVINPRHELEAAQLTLDATGLHAVCGHELTNELNFVERATTAAMNAKLIPLIEALLAAVRQALDELGLPDTKVMVVKGDGSQMLDDVAVSVPVETLLSGPAASVVGAARLFSNADAVVADMGGTTLDVALLKNGAPELSERGARIADFQTCVRAMAVQTIGLGGDSEIDLSTWPRVRIGPRRITPLCRLHEDFPELPAKVPNLLREFATRDANAAELVAATHRDGQRDSRLLQHLSDGPRLLGELARVMVRPSPAYLRWDELESEGYLKRFGLTLTDVLHYERAFQAFDREIVNAALAHWSMLLDADIADIVSAIHHEFRRKTCDTVLAVALEDSTAWRADRKLRHWLTEHFAATRNGGTVTMRPQLSVPLIAVGAPVATLFPQLGPVFQQDVLVSEFAHVANAVGAIAGDVLLRESAGIRLTQEGAFICSWRGGTDRASGMESALQTCEQALCSLIEADADANDIPYTEPMFSAVQQQAQTRDGTMLLGITLHGELRG